MTVSLKNPLTQTIAAFLEEIGIELAAGQIGSETFLPGILVNQGKILIDEAKLKYPGDLLHEAGHIAVCPARWRSSLSGEVDLPNLNMDLIEAQAIAWSYAACLHLNLDPKVVFHKDGYRGQSEGLLLSFRVGVYPGVSQLQAAGMAATNEMVRDLSALPYPHLLKWLRE